MKKLLITTLLATLAFSSTAQSSDRELFLLGAGLLGLGIAIGDGNTSFGVHFSNGYYNYNGHRYRSRLDYLRAVDRYEARRRYLASRNRIQHPLFNSRTISITNSRSSYYRHNDSNRSDSSDRNNSSDRGDRSRSDSRSDRDTNTRSRNSSAASFALRRQ